MENILSSERFVTVEPIEKGWSGDKKYCVVDAIGTKYLLRITPIERYEARKSLYAMLEQVAELGIPMCTPVEFGVCPDGVYSLQTWIDGDDLKETLASLPETEQYVLGLQSGKILNKMHSISAPNEQEEWSSQFNLKIDNKIHEYLNCGIKFDGDDHVLEYIENNRGLLENRPQCFQHGDYHVGNMMLEYGELRIIDFDRHSFGDPWEEFNRIVFCAQVSPHFATGQLHGYFDGEPPFEFFKLLALYSAVNMLASITWAIQFGKNDIDFMLKLSQDNLKWYDNMQNPIPTWYLKNYEVWDIYDVNGNKTGRYHERGKPVATGDYHIVVYVWKYNSKGEWLIDKRTERYGRGNFDNKWETTGGCAIVGDDSLAAALRETKEELGIDLDPQKGMLYKRTPRIGKDGHTWFEDVWVFEYDEPIESVAYDGSEVCDAMWATVEKIREMVKAGEFVTEYTGSVLYPYFDEMVEKYRLK
ncbi:MAG: phosphotransferase [Oscillospiraceae bacterium]|nr:phosphotransferase [Oscillospiraceae bacterium]